MKANLRKLAQSLFEPSYLPTNYEFVGMQVILVLSGAVALVNGVIYFLAGATNNFVVESSRLVVLLAFYAYGMAWKSYRIGFYGMLVASWAGITALVYTQGGIQLSSYIHWALVFGPIIISSGAKALGWLVSLATILAFVLIGWLDAQGLVPKDYVLSEGRRTFSASHAMFTLAVVSAVLTHWRGVLTQQASDARKAQELFSASVNHELRTPLNAVITGAELLARMGPNPEQEKQQTILRSLATTAEHLKDLNNELLDIERVRSGSAPLELAAFSMYELLRETEEILWSQAMQAGVILRMRKSPDMHANWVGSKSRIKQVLINLLGNSIKHAPNCNIDLYCSEGANGTLMFEIEDDGPGIPAETRAKLFAPFAASKGKKGSTGLGMYLCKVLVENGMRGTIEVDERQPSGVKFTVVLPLAKTEQA